MALNISAGLRPGRSSDDSADSEEEQAMKESRSAAADGMKNTRMGQLGEMWDNDGIAIGHYTAPAV